MSVKSYFLPRNLLNTNSSRPYGSKLHFQLNAIRDLNFPPSKGLSLFPIELNAVCEAPRREDFHKLSDDKTFTRLTDLNCVCCQSPPASPLSRSWRREPSLARARDRPRPWSGDCRTSPVSPPSPTPTTTTTSPAGASTPGSACCCRTAGPRPPPWRGTPTSPASPPPPPRSPPGPPSRPPREPPSTPTARPSCPGLLLLLTLPHSNTPSPASSPAGGSRSRAPAARWRTAPAAPLRARPRVLPPAPPRPGGSCRTLPARGTSRDSSLLLSRRPSTPAQRLGLQTLPGQHQHQIRPSFTLTVRTVLRGDLYHPCKTIPLLAWREGTAKKLATVTGLGFSADLLRLTED